MPIHRRKPPHPQIRWTIMGETEIYRCENLVGPFLVHTFGSQTPPPLLFYYTPRGGGATQTGVMAKRGAGGQGTLWRGDCSMSVMQSTRAIPWGCCLRGCI